MNNSLADEDPQNPNDEIDLRELFISLWRGKYLIIVCLFVSIVLASFYLRSAERKYSVSYVMMPVASESSRPNFGQLGGLASLAGVSLPSSSSSDFTTFKFLLKSEVIADRLLSDETLIREIFASEWDNNSGTYKKPPDGTLSPYKRSIKTLLTGQSSTEYAPPNSQRIASWLKGAFSLSEDHDTGFLTISSETAIPELMVSVIKRTTEETDRLLKQRYVTSAEQTVRFYQDKLQKARSQEHREALAKLIAQEDQKLMLASRGSEFVAEAVTEPTVSLFPTSPKNSLVLALSVVLGGFFGAAFVLFRKSLTS